MSSRLCLLVLGIAAVTVACSGQGSQPVSPSAAAGLADHSAAAVPLGSMAIEAGPAHKLGIFDNCDPATFNAAVGPGTCIGSGTRPFGSFIEELTRFKTVAEWHFTPALTTVKVGETFTAFNRGGEIHTFTEVEDFGGGINPTLNALSGQTTVAPECNQLPGAAFIPPGGSTTDKADDPGVEKYQCCIHPWMRAQVRITLH